MDDRRRAMAIAAAECGIGRCCCFARFTEPQRRHGWSTEREEAKGSARISRMESGSEDVDESEGVKALIDFGLKGVDLVILVLKGYVAMDLHI